MRFDRAPAALLLAAGVCLAAAWATLAPRGSAAAQQPVNETRKRIHVADPLEEQRAHIDALIDAKDFASAVDALQKYLASRPDDAVAHFQLGYSYTGLARRAEAEVEYRKAIALDPKMAPAYQNLGLSLLDGDPAAAAEPLRKAVELQPANPQANYLLALALDRSGKTGQAAAQYEVAEKLAVNTVELHCNRGKLLLDLNRPGEAEQEFRLALGLRPDSPAGHVGLAESLLAQKQPAAAVPELRAYLQMKPGDDPARLRLASALAGLKQYDQALAELDRVNSSGAAAVTVARLRGEVYMAQKNYAEAAAAFQSAVALAPGDANLHARLGHALLSKSDLPAAQRELAAALRLDARLPEALGDLMAAFYLQKNYSAALQALDLLDRRETPPPASWFIRATCYDRLGQKKEALEAYRKFLNLDQGRNDRESFQARERIKTLQLELEKRK